jgi:peptide/nickel transport system ATP-binding protein
VALVGESGSGKTTLARALAGVGERSDGELFFEGQPLPFEARRRSKAQRSAIQYVFQNPHRALNPRRTVGQILLETLRFFFPDHQAPRARVAEVLTQVALRPEVQSAYPRSLSGGECQRVALARALICAPKLIICDEVTSALDVSVQATILELLRSLQASGLSILFVTHDIGVVRTLADRVFVLHEGRIVETGARDRVLDEPVHVYTRELLKHTPSLA